MKALINVPHPEAAHSLRIMLESIGFEVEQEMDRTSDLVIAKLLYNEYNIDKSTCDEYDIYAAVKPEQLENKKNPLLFLINGGKRSVTDYGYPTITSNFNIEQGFVDYVPWFNRLGIKPREKLKEFEKPIGFLHGGYGWGFARYFPALESSVDIYGWRSPEGLIPQFTVRDKLAKAKCFVHLKSNDAPGYALYEAFASGVPIIVPQYFINATRFQDMFIDGETCLVFGKDAESLRDDTTRETKEHYDKIINEIKDHIKRLSDPDENYRIGINGLFNWKKLTRWTSEKANKLKSYLKQYNYV